MRTDRSQVSIVRATICGDAHRNVSVEQEWNDTFLVTIADDVVIQLRFADAPAALAYGLAWVTAVEAHMAAEKAAS